MHNTKITIGGLEETVTYPIVVGSAVAIKKLLGLQPTVPVTIGQNAPLYTTRNAAGLNDHTPDILTEELHIEYSESSSEDSAISLNAWAPRTRPIYSDPDTKSIILPILNTRTLRLDVTYYSTSKSGVTKIANNLRMRAPADAGHIVDDLEYFYYIPPIVLELLMSINDKKNTHTVPPVDLDTYLNNTFSPTATILNTASGDIGKIKLGIREVQQFVLGRLDNTLQEITKDKDDETNRWSINVTYVIDYEAPTQLLVRYPMLVYNQPIDAKFRLAPVSSPKPTSGYTSADSSGIDAVAASANSLIKIPDNSYYVHIPQEDMLILPKPDDGYVRLFSVLAQLDIANPTHLFYLDEIPSIALQPDIIALLHLEAARLGPMYQSLFNISLYDSSNRVYNHTVVVSVVTQTINGVLTDRLSIDTGTPLGIQGEYRVCLNILAELSSVKAGAITLLNQSIDTVNTNSVNPVGFNVLDTALSILNVDTSIIDPRLVITPTTTTMEIAMNILPVATARIYTKQVTMVLTDVLIPK